MSTPARSDSRTPSPPPTTGGPAGAAPESFTATVSRRPLRLEPVPEAYLALADDYERRTALFAGWRELLVGLLVPRRGDVVLDVGCGTGLNFAALQDRVGPGGRIIGIDESPQMLAIAARQVARRRWDNVTLINAPAEVAELSATTADAALFCAVHDVLQPRWRWPPSATTCAPARRSPPAAGNGPPDGCGPSGSS